MKLSILIVNWNGRHLLEKCLDAVYAYPPVADFEVILVDNASGDESAALVRSCYPQVRLIENARNVGFARANNQAIQVATGEYYLLLNTDAFVRPGTLSELIRFMDATPQAGAAGCRLEYADGSLQLSAFAFPTVWTELWTATWLDRLFARSRIFGAYRMTYWDFRDTRPVDSVMGACMIVRRAAVDQTGGLDESFFMFSEEVDLCYRLRKAGWQVFYVPEAAATHLWGGSTQIKPEKSFLDLYQSRIQFFRKHQGPLNAGLVKLVWLLGGSLRVVIGSLLQLFRGTPENRQVVKNYGALLRSIGSF